MGLSMVKSVLFLGVFLLLATLSSAESDQTVYVTKTGWKYHRAGCSHLKKSAIPLKLADLSGVYSACSKCNPPKMDNKKAAAGIQEKKDSAPKNQETVYTNDTGGSAAGNGYTDSDLSSYSRSTQGTSGGSSQGGKTVYTGPRGGQYHYSSSGKKVYERRRK